VAGCVVCRQKPLTAKGHVFITLEDETGLVNAILRPGVYDRFRQTARREPHIVIEGRLQKRDGVINIIAETLEPIATKATEASASLEAAVPRARNFC
jgi:error-prone DNA polymerase